MEPFEYFVVLSSLILGLGIAQLLTGIADVVSNIDKVKVGYAHIVFVLNIFILHVQEWWYSYQYIYQVKMWTLPLIFFLLTYPILLFLLARMIFPTGTRSHEVDLKAYFFGQWKWFYSMMLGIVVISFLQNIVVSGWAIDSQMPQYILSLAFIAFIFLDIKSHKAHNVFVTVQAIAWIVYTILDPYELGG